MAMDTHRPLQIMLPSHAHQALRLFAITQNRTLTQVVIEAIDRAYPEVQAKNATRNDSLVLGREDR